MLTTISNYRLLKLKKKFSCHLSSNLGRDDNILPSYENSLFEHLGLAKLFFMGRIVTVFHEQDAVG